MAYKELLSTKEIEKLHQNISHFKKETERLKLSFIKSFSSIQCCIISGNDTVKTIATQLQNHGFDVKPILSPTVAKEQERLRFCIHSYNSKEEISEVLQLLATFVRL